jgi:hypothetical protein
MPIQAVMKRPWSRGDFCAGQYCSRPPKNNVLLTNQDAGGFKLGQTPSNADIPTVPQRLGQKQGRLMSRPSGFACSLSGEFA